MRHLLAALFCCMVFTTQAGEIKGIFLQPQQSDLAIPLNNWPQIFAAARSKGFNTLIIQWTSYGDVFSSQANQEWLKDRMIQASQANLKLIVGLAGDPEIFTRLKQPPSILGGYFRKMNQANLEMAIKWSKTLPKGIVSGWYLPLEIDDRQWRELPARTELTKYLTRQVNDLNKIIPMPIYISSFFAGNMTPERYAAMLENIEAQSKVNLWIQDGRGTGKLISAERELYLDAVSNCNGFKVSGYIFEIFLQTKADHQFAAVPLSPNEMTTALKQQSPCGGDNVFFALNYLVDFKNPN
jgi:hypothetical protein